MAAAAATRDLMYFTFGDANFADELKGIYQCLKSMSISAGKVHSALWEVLWPILFFLNDRPALRVGCEI